MCPNYRTGWLDVERSSVPAHAFLGATASLPQPPALSWVRAHDHAFDLTPQEQGKLPEEERGERWHSGHVEALCPLGNSVVVGAVNSGLWLVNPEYNAVPASESFPAIPLSWNSSNPAVRCLARGKGPLEHVIFVGCNEIPQLDYLSAVEIRPVLGGYECPAQATITGPPLPNGHGGIWALLFLDDTTLLAGTGDGVWWATVSDDPLSTWLPAWQRANGVWGRVTTLAAGPNRSIVAGVDGYPGPAGVWHGDWSASGQLDFTQVLQTKGRTSVASCSADRNRGYAVAADGDNLGGTWKSVDGGVTWAMFPSPTNPGGQGGYNNCIAVHPTNPDIVAIGWRTGPFIWDPTANDWQLRTDEQDFHGHMHSDVHALVFDEAPDGMRLWAGTDGGLCLSLNEGRTWDSRYNRHLVTAQVYSTLVHTLEEYGLGNDTKYERDNSCFHVSATTAGLIGIATQDNGTLITREFPAGHHSFYPCNGGDGQSVLIVDDLVFHCDNTSNELRMSRRLATGVTDGSSQIVPVDNNALGLRKLALGSTHAPTHSVNGRRVIAIAGGSTAVLILLEPNTPTSNADLQTIASLPPLPGATPTPQVISAVASYDGSEVLAGTVDGHVYRIIVDSKTITPEVLPATAPTAPIRRLRWRDAEHPLGVFGDGGVYRRDGGAWVRLVTLPVAVKDVDSDPLIARGAIFAAADDGVYCSIDRGTTWTDCSEGLPETPSGTSIQVTNAGDDPAVYFATYGWGVFRASLRENDTTTIPPINKKVAKILFGVIQDGGGIEIRGGHAVPVPPMPYSRQLAAALAITALASELEGAKAVEISALANNIVRHLAQMRSK